MAIYSTSARAKAIIRSAPEFSATQAVDLNVDPLPEADLVLRDPVVDLIVAPPETDLIVDPLPEASLTLTAPNVFLFPQGGSQVATLKVTLEAIKVAEDKTYRFTAFTSPGVVRNLTGEVVHISFKKKRADATEVINKDSGTPADILIVVAADGTFNLLISTVQSAALQPGVLYEGDAFIVDGSGDRIHYGELFLPVAPSAVVFP